jgi:hypothetical protein
MLAEASVPRTSLNACATLSASSRRRVAVLHAFSPSPNASASWATGLWMWDAGVCKHGLLTERGAGAHWSGTGAPFPLQRQFLT